jgi:hypothetical protein
MFKAGIVIGILLAVAGGMFVAAASELRASRARGAGGRGGAATTTTAKTGAAVKAEKRLEIVRTADGHAEVWYVHDGVRVNLTRFSRPQLFSGMGISADGRWAYVWHHARPPRVLSIYDLSSLKRVASFSPGYGGELQWLEGNRILHYWGAGAACVMYAVYDVQGKTVLKGTTSGWDLAPGGTYLATSPSFAAEKEPLVIRDLRTLKVVYDSTGKADVRVVEEVRWEAGDTVAVQYLDSAEEKREMTIRLGKK